MKKYAVLLIVAVLAGSWGGDYAGAAKPAADRQEQNQAGTTAGMTSGQVRKIDKDTGNLTLKHEKIANLNMPPMTMVFKVQDKSVLQSLQVGDTVWFKAIDRNGVLTITEIK